MVLQVLADTGQLVLDGDAERLQQRAGPDARQLQQLRRADGAGPVRQSRQLQPGMWIQW